MVKLKNIFECFILDMIKHYYKKISTLKTSLKLLFLQKKKKMSLKFDFLVNFFFYLEFLTFEKFIFNLSDV